MEPPPRKYVQLFFRNWTNCWRQICHGGPNLWKPLGGGQGGGLNYRITQSILHLFMERRLRVFFSRKEGKITKNDLYWIHSIWIIIYICHTEINPARSCVQEFFLVIFYNKIWIALCTNRSLVNDNGLPYVRIGRRWPIKKKCHFQRHFSWERPI